MTAPIPARTPSTLPSGSQGPAAETAPSRGRFGTAASGPAPQTVAPESTAAAAVASPDRGTRDAESAASDTDSSATVVRRAAAPGSAAAAGFRTAATASASVHGTDTAHAGSGAGSGTATTAVGAAPGDFAFYRPADLAEAVRLLAEHPDVVPVAGGTDLMVAVNYRLARPQSMLDLTGLAELREWTDEGDSIRIGSGVPYARIVAELATVLPGLAAASRTVGSPQIRNRGTLGGNLATASPAGDGHPPLLATGATIEIASAASAEGPSNVPDFSAVPIDALANPTTDPFGGPAEAAIRRLGGSATPDSPPAVGTAGRAASPADGSAALAPVRTRTVPIAEFFTGPKRSVLRPGELITAVTVPKAAGPQQFLKVGTRNAMVIAVCSLAVALDLETRRVGTGIGSAGPTPLTAPAANRIELPWTRPGLFNDALAEEFGRRVAAAARPIDDVRGTADYRRHALAVCAARALRRVWTAAHSERTT